MKIRINNDIILKWSVFRQQEPEDFNSVISVCIEIIHPYTRIKYSPQYTIAENVITIQYPAKKQIHTGEYMLLLQYSKPDYTIEGGVSTFTVDYSDAFCLVEKSNQSGSPSEKEDLKITTVQLNSNIDRDSDGRDGITPSIGTNGNWFLGSTDTGKPSHGKDFKYTDFTEDQLLFLRKPASDAAQSAKTAISDIRSLESTVSGNENNRIEAENLRLQTEEKRVTDFSSFLTTSSGQVKTEVDKVTPVITSCSKATEDANAAALSATTQASYANTQGDYAKEQATGIDLKIGGKADKSISYASFIGDCVLGSANSISNSAVSQDLINLSEGIYYLEFYQLQSGGNPYQQKYLRISVDNESFSIYNDGYFHSILHKINDVTVFYYKDTNSAHGNENKFKEQGAHCCKINTILGKVEYYLNGGLWQTIEIASLEMKSFMGATVEIGLNGYTTKNCFVNFTCALQETEYKDFIPTADYLYPVMQKSDAALFNFKKGNEPIFYYDAKILNRVAESEDYIELEIPNTGGAQKHGVISSVCSSVYSRGSFWGKFELVSGTVIFKSATAAFMLYDSAFKYLGQTNMTISEPGVYYYVAKHGAANPTSYFNKYATYVITTEPCIIRLDKRFFGWVGELTVCAVNGTTYNTAGYIFSTFIFKSIYPDSFIPVKKAIFPVSLPTPEIIGQKAYLKSETSSYLAVTDSLNRLIWKKITV